MKKASPTTNVKTGGKDSMRGANNIGKKTLSSVQKTALTASTFVSMSDTAGRRNFEVEEEDSYEIRDSSSIKPSLSLRPTSSTDAWFMLNLLSSIPFIQDLPFSSTMELLELGEV